MSEVIREGAVRVGVDLAKRVIQVHAVDAGERVLTWLGLKSRTEFKCECDGMPGDPMPGLRAPQAIGVRFQFVLRTSTACFSAWRKRAKQDWRSG